jgi:hypothetical protein
VGIRGNQNVIASGTCEPGDYWGGPETLANFGFGSLLGLGGGVSDLGAVCGERGRAKGMPARRIEQVDEMSGGTTSTSIPHLEGHIPAANSVLSGRFRAVAETGFPSANGGFVPAAARVSLTIRHAGHVVFHSADVERPGGVSVRRLASGNYWATWVVSDRNGDTRAVATRFEES